MHLLRLLCFLLGCVPGFAALPSARDGLRLLPSSDGFAAAAIVTDRPLVFTAQVFGVTNAGGAVSGDATTQAARTLQNLKGALASAGAESDRVVRVHVYVTGPEVTPAVNQELKRFFPEGKRPPVAYVVGKLPVEGACVGMDAIAALRQERAGTSARRFSAASGASGELESQAAILPAGPAVFVSGRAEPGTIERASRDTMAKLGADLQGLGLSKKDIVQVKAFVAPMSETATVRREIAAFFGPERMPPLVIAEWLSTSRPVEIELVAAAGTASASAPRVEYLTPPGDPANPLFTRIVRVNRGALIFTAGLLGGTGAAEEQVRGVFAELQQVLALAGSDFEHMAKATYYVTDESSSSQLNAVRRELYPPQRPPAASKISVTGTGFPDRTVTLDMIAVGR